jgi:hypothetical protein
MASMPPSGAAGNSQPQPPVGWIARLVAALERAVFEASWAPWIRLIVTAIVIAGIYVGILWVIRGPA